MSKNVTVTIQYAEAMMILRALNTHHNAMSALAVKDTETAVDRAVSRVEAREARDLYNRVAEQTV